jgi:hypothetical protein
MKMKYVVVSGGVVSGLGKGVTASSIGAVLKGCGLRVSTIKIGSHSSPPSPPTTRLILGIQHRDTRRERRQQKKGAGFSVEFYPASQRVILPASARGCVGAQRSRNKNKTLLLSLDFVEQVCHFGIRERRHSPCISAGCLRLGCAWQQLAPTRFSVRQHLAFVTRCLLFLMGLDVFQFI